MNTKAVAWVAMALVSLVAPAQAGETWPPPADQTYGRDAPEWLTGLAGQKLVAVDGSTITLSSSEGGLALAQVSSNGAADNTSFAYVSDRMGTIADAADSGHVIGFFRETDNGLEAQFADGRTESLVVNTQGGLSLTVRASAGDSACTSWFPPDHVFGAAERRAALAAYAERLGLGEKTKKSAHPVSTCAPAIHVAKSDGGAHASHALMAMVHPGMPAMGAGLSDATLKPVIVRTSQVHMIDGGSAQAQPAPLPQAQPAPPPAQMLAPPPAAQATAPVQTVALPDVHGASDCLSVESDGANFGFRNHCAYGVEFAYCLRQANDPATDCNNGTRTGAIIANGFTPVLLDTNIKSAEHDFRWVACSGNTGDVVAHLDRVDPPAGRCLRSNAS